MASKSLKSCDPNVKQQLQQAGCHLTEEQEHLIANNPKLQAINWGALLQALGNAASQVIPIILAIIAAFNPTPKPVQAGGGGGGMGGSHPHRHGDLSKVKCDPNGCCDHCEFAEQLFESAMFQANMCAMNLACCHCERDCQGQGGNKPTPAPVPTPTPVPKKP